MAHARQTIREAVAALITGLVTTSTRVYQSRIFPFQTADLPALNVMTIEETVEHISGTKTLRMLQVQIDGYAKASTNIDDTLDTISAEVEAAMYGSPNISGSVTFAGLVSTAIELDGESEKPVGKISMIFNVEYYVDATDPTVIL